MALIGDERKRARTKLDEQGGLAQNRLNNLWDITIPQNQNFWNAYLEATGLDRAQREKLNAGYDDLTAKYGDWAKTGGVSPLDEANLRARAISPIRAAYSNAQAGVDRSRRLQGDYAPNAIATKAKLAREVSQGLSDATLGAETNLFDLRNRGKQFGMQGLSNTLEGARGLFGTAPGQTSMAGNQVLNSTGQLLNLGGQQSNLASDLIRAQMATSQIPGLWDNVTGKINDVFDIGKKVAGFYGGASNLWSPYSPTNMNKNLPSGGSMF